MSDQGNVTSMGGGGENFAETHWSVLDLTRAADEARRREAIGRIVQQYWKPVYCYLRRKGHSDEDAKDLTQGFFHEIALRQSFLQKADPNRGRFRNLLLTALNHYVIDVKRAAGRHKRMPATGLLRLDGMDWRNVPMPAEADTPQEAFVYAWARDLLQKVLSELEAEYRGKDMAPHWELFRAKLIVPILEGTPSPSLAELAQAHGVPDAKRASNMIVTVRRRFQAVLRGHLRAEVRTEDRVDDELRDLMEILSHPPRSRPDAMA